MRKTRKKYNCAFKEKAVEFPIEHNILPVQLHKWREEQKELRPGIFPDNGKLKQAPKQESLSEIEKKRIEGVDTVIARSIVDVADAFHSVGSMSALFSKEV